MLEPIVPTDGARPEIIMPQNQAANAALRRRFVGLWRLVSATQGGQAHPDRGANSTGCIVYHESGNMAVQVMPGHARAKFAAADAPTPQEAQAALRGYIAYFGTWDVDAASKTVIHRRKGSLNPSTIEDVVRRFEFDGNDRVTLNPVEHPANTITWERIR